MYLFISDREWQISDEECSLVSLIPIVILLLLLLLLFDLLFGVVVAGSAFRLWTFISVSISSSSSSEDDEDDEDSSFLAGAFLAGVAFLTGAFLAGASSSEEEESRRAALLLLRCFAVLGWGSCFLCWHCLLHWCLLLTRAIFGRWALWKFLFYAFELLRTS